MTQEYFYGLSNDLSPHSNIANFSDLFVYRVGGGPQAPRSALPIGAEPAADPTRVVPVNINRDLLHLVLAVTGCLLYWIGCLLSVTSAILHVFRI